MFRIADQDRPLTERGIQDALLIAKELKRLGVKPDLILCSASVRTWSTALILSRELQVEFQNVRASLAFYESDADTYRQILCGVDDRAESVMLIGHNPTVSEMVREAVGDPSLADFPTSAVFALTLAAGTWKEMNRKVGAEKLFYIFPRQFKPL